MGSDTGGVEPDASAIAAGEPPAGDRRHLALRSFYNETRDLNDPAAIVAAVVRLMDSHLDGAEILYFEVAGEEGRLSLLAPTARPPLEPQERATLDAALDALANLPEWTATRVIDDATKLPGSPHEPNAIIAELMHVRAGISVPIVKDSRRVAAMTVFDPRPRHWSADEVGLCEDIAEALWAAIARARAEATLLERERAQSLLIDWTDRIRGETEADAIIATSLELLGRHLGVRRATYSLSDPAGEVFTVCGEWRQGMPSIAGAQFTMAPVGADIADAWERGGVFRSDDATRDPRIAPAMLPLYAETDIRAFVSVPLIEHGRVRASLSVQHDEPRRWREGEVQLLRDVAERIWVVLERTRAEAELQERGRSQALLIDWTDRVRGETDPAAVVQVTLEMLARHLGVTRATYSQGDVAGWVFTVTGEWRDEGVDSIAQTSFSLDDVGAVVRREWVSGEIVRYDDTTTDARLEDDLRAAYADTQIHAFVSIPLIERDRVRAALSVQHRAPRRWSEGELQLLRDIGERMWVVLERARAESALKERERNQSFLIEWADLIRDESDPDTIIALTLERLGRWLGITRTTYSEGDVTGRRLHNRGEWLNGVDSIASVVFDLDQVGEAVAQAWLSGAAICYDDVESDPRIPAGRAAFFAATQVRSLLTIPQIEAGKVRCALSLQSRTPRSWQPAEIALARDVAERVWIAVERARAEAELQQRERNQAFLIDWSDRIRREATPEGIVATTLQWLGRHLGVTRTTYAEMDGDMFVVSDEWRDGASSIRGNRFALPSVGAAVDRQWHAGEVIRYDDVAADGRLEPAAVERYRDRDIAAFVSIPLVQNGQMQSALSIQNIRPRAWADHDVQLIRDIAERTWVALERARASAALQERERAQAFLVAWNDAVRGEASARVILAKTVRMLAGHLGAARANYAEPDQGFGTMTVIEEYSDGTVQSVRGTTYSVDDFGERLAAAQRRGETIRVDDVHDHPLFDATNRPLFDAIGVRSVITIPMIRRGEILANLSVQHSTARRWTDSEVELLRDVADRTLSVLERAQSEARLAESEAQLSAFMDHAPVAMTLRDQDGHFIRANPEFGRSIGRPLDEVIGMKAADLFVPEVARQVDALTDRARAGEVAHVELSNGLEERYSSVLAIAFPIGDGSGAAKTAGFTIDLTERRRAEAALAKSRETLYQAEKLTALGSLLAGVSHELNNPLSIVMAQAVMMERQSQGTPVAERAQKIRKAAERCARIVQTFLAMAREKRPERKAVDLNAVAIAAHELAEFGLKNDGITTLRALTPGLPPISADSDQIHQIVINLILNAQHAMVDAGVADATLTLRSGPGRAPGTVMLEVADNGPGIPPDVQRRIFEPFYTTKPQGQGTGVGLSFSQGVAEAHGGRLELVPGPAGACFRLTMPIDAEGDAVADVPDDDVLALPPVRRALVIDDEQEIAEALADFLSLDGFACDVAVGGADAKARLAAGSYDLVISDLRMPGIDGPTLHAWIKAERPELADRIAFATGDTLGQSVARFLADVDRPVLEKPFTPEAVHRLLEQMDLA